MSRGLRLLSFGLGTWALLAVVRAIRLAEILATGGGGAADSMWSEVAIWLIPTLVGGLVAVVMVSRPASGVDEYLARSVRMGVMVAMFGVLLSWMLVIYAAYLQRLGQP